MSFPNAFEGVKKIYLAELLSIIGGVAGILTVIFTALVAAFLFVNEVLSGLMGILVVICGLITLVVTIIAFILNIIGISTASRDEELFKKAMTMVIVGILASVAGNFFKGGNILSDLMNTICSVAGSISSFLVSYYVIQAIMSLAGRLGNSMVADSAQQSIRMLVIAYGASIVVEVLDMLIGFFSVGAFITGLFGVVSLVASLVAFIIYLRVLSQAKTMLQNA